MGDFGAQADALPQTLIHGCHRPPAVTTAPLFPSSMDLHESPANFYTRVFLHSLRLPSLRLLGLPSDDILAVEDALKQSLLSLPLPQALDVLHTQLLSCICVSTPRRETSAPGPNQGAPPIACYLCPVDGSRTTPSPPPVFRCWIGRKVSPNMAILDFKCDSLPWAASYIKGTTGRSLFGLSPGNFIQLVFPTTEQFLSDAPYFGLALYLTSVTTKGRVLEEQPEEQTDSGGSQVTQFSGILLPFLLKSTTQSGTLIHQMHLPLFAKREQLHELVAFPPLDMARTFYMPLSSPRGLFSELLKVPFYRIPKTLGWPFLDSPMPSYFPQVTSLRSNPPPLPPHNPPPLPCRPGLSLWQVPPHPFTLSHLHKFISPADPHRSLRSRHRSSQNLPISLPYSLLHSFTYRPGLSLWQVPPSTLFPLYLHTVYSPSQSPTAPFFITHYLHHGPAYHCGWSRHVPLGSLLSTSRTLLGLTCQPSTSRPLPLPSSPLSFPFPSLSPSHPLSYLSPPSVHVLGDLFVDWWH